MPDQHIAATEHSLLQEVAEPLSTLPDDPVAIAARTDFPVVMRGYDRAMVDEYVKHTTRLVAELQATRSPEADIRRALERVGQEVSGILQRAHETADRITSQSRAEAEERLELSRREAAEFTAGAELRVKQLDAETDRIWIERQRIVDDVNELAAKLTSLAESALERFPAEEPVEEPAASPPAGETESAAEIESPYDDEAGPHAEGGPHEQAGHDDEVVDEKAAEAGPPSPGKVERAGGADADAAVTQVMRWNRPSVSEARDH